MTFNPLNDRVLVIREDMHAETTPGGIIIPEMARETPQICKVVAVGPGYRNDKTGEWFPLSVEPGDTVYINKWAGDELKIDGVESLILREIDILGIIDTE